MFHYLFGRYLTNAKRLTPEKLSGLIERSRLEIIIGRRGFEEGSPEYDGILKAGEAVNRKLSELIAAYDTSSAPQNASLRYTPNYLFFKGLIRENIIPADGLTDELALFTKYYALDKDGVSKNFETDAEAIFASFVNSGDYFANQYMTVMIKHILRFVGANVNFSQSSVVFSYSAERMAVQKVVTGSGRYFIGIGAEKAAMIRLNGELADDYAGGQQRHYDNLLSCFNSVSCMFQSMIEREKEIMFVDSPTVYKFSTVSVDEQCFMLPITVDEDLRLDLLVGFGEKPNFAKISHNI